jgi:ribonuclease HI
MVVPAKYVALTRQREGEGQAKEQTSGFPGALHQGFQTKSDALTWYRDEGGVLSDEQLQETENHDHSEYMSEDAKVRTQYDIPPLAQIIYTDGACPSNGLQDPQAGIGIFFSPNSEHNVSARLPGPRQTNQRAELYAVLKALEHLHTHPPPPPAHIVILTDSRYAQQALTEWVYKWEREGWRTANRGEVVSKDLFKRAKDMLDSLGERGTIVKLKHVRGHAGVWGNEMADKLAVKGANLEPVVDAQWDKAFDDPELEKLIEEMVGV